MNLDYGGIRMEITERDAKVQCRALPELLAAKVGMPVRITEHVPDGVHLIEGTLTGFREIGDGRCEFTMDVAATRMDDAP